MSPEVLNAANSLRQFLFGRVYNPSLSREEAVKAREILRLLYSYFLRHEDELPQEFASLPDSKERKIVDYIAGMTDQYALRLATEIPQ
jgi:dGTPase